MGAQGRARAMGEVRLGLGEFTPGFDTGECELLDTRVLVETAAWQFNVGLPIPADALPACRDHRPRARLRMVACPLCDRCRRACP